MICPTCRAENPSENRFCEQCGEALDARCPSCGATVRAGARFCGACGARLGAAEPPKDAAPRPAIARSPYTPKHLADKILTARAALEGERRIVTVLFADIAGFTSLAERLDPEDVHRIIDRCFEVVTAEIHRFEGTINQYAGDGVMALFGAPIAHEDAPRRAVHAALGIQGALREISKELEAEHGFPLRMRIGLNTGLVVVGRIGDDLRMDYTAIGDTTNLAARLEQTAQPGAVLVSEATHRAIAGYFETLDLGEVRVKGHAAPVRAFEVVRAKGRRARLDFAAGRERTPLVGRERELTQLEDLYELVKGGRGQVVFLAGDAGIGKSRLVEEFRRRLAERGEAATWLEGRCISFGQSIPFLPLVDQLRENFGIEESDGEPEIIAKVERVMRRMGALEAHVPAIRYLLSVDPGDPAIASLEPAARRKRLFDALQALAIRGSKARPIVFVYEDLHWIDTSSEEYLRILLDSVAGAPILVIPTYRFGYSPPFGARSFFTTITLHSLSEAETLRLAGNVLGSDEFPPELRAALMEKAEGVPLFVEEVAKTLVDVGILRRVGGRFEMVRGLGADVIPDTIQGIIMARLDRLGENGKRTVQLASVIGRQFLVRLLERIAGLTGELEGLLQELKALEIIYEQGLLQEPAYVFKHAVIQDVAYNSLLRDRRRELHASVGGAIEELWADRLADHYEELAYHFGQGERWQKALEYSMLAGDRAVHAFANLEARRHFERARAAAARLDPPYEPPRLVPLLQKLAAVLTCLGEFDDAVACYEEALGIVRDAGDRRGEVEALLGLSGVYNYSHQGEPAIEYNDKALAIARELDDRSFITACLSNRVQIRSAGYGEIAETLPDAEEAAALSKEVGDPRLLALTGCFLGGAFAWRGDFDRGLEHLRESIDLAEQTGQGFLYGYSAFMAGHACVGKGDYEAALEWYGRLGEYASASGDRFWVARHPNVVGGVHLELFDLERSIEQNLEGEDAARRVWAWPEPQGHALLKIGLAWLERGEHGRAQEYFQRAWNLLEGDTWYRWRWHIPLLRARGELARREGRRDDAWKLAEESLAMARRTTSQKHVVRALRLQGEILADSNRADEAAVTLGEAFALARRLEALPEVWHTGAACARVLASLGRDRESEQAWLAAADAVAAIADPLRPGLRLRFLEAEPVKGVLAASGRRLAPPSPPVGASGATEISADRPDRSSQRG